MFNLFLIVSFILLFISPGEEHRGLPGKTCSSEEAEGKVGIFYSDVCFLGEISADIFHCSG